MQISFIVATFNSDSFIESFDSKVLIKMLMLITTLIFI